MSQSGKLTPNLDEKTTKVLNLTVLQRVDPFVEEILLTAAHVTFYELNIENNQWSRKDVEGSLFVVKRNAQPRFQFIVMNRRNTDNLVENLLGDFEYEVQVPYLLYRNASQEVNGIWFYNSRECEEVANLFSRILNAYAKVPAKSKISPQSDFQELEAVTTLTVMDGPLEPSSTAGNVTDIPDDPAFMNFFSVPTCLPFKRVDHGKHLQNALNIEVAPNVAVSPQPYFSPSNAIYAHHPQTVALPTVPAAQTPYNLSTSRPLMFVLESTQHNNAAKFSTDLVNPSSLFRPSVSSHSLITPPVSSSMPSAPPLNPPGGMHRPYGAPLLQPFPPPTPPPSLTPTATAPSYGLLTRVKVQNALQLLVQDDQFIDMVHRALLAVHQS